MSHTRLRRKKAQGAVLVEMALSLMIMILLCFGAMEYGWLFFRLQQVTNAAQAGARIGVLPDATNGDVQARIDNLMGSFGLSGHTVTITPGDVSAVDTGDLITVRVEVPYGAEAGLLQMGIFPTPSSLPCSVAMAKEGP